MQYTALISRMYQAADEALQIVIQDTDTFDTFKERVLTALSICDFRANEHMYRLFADSDLVNNLDQELYNKAWHGANLIYPRTTLLDKIDLGSETKLEFSKNLASGEVLKIFLHEINTYEDINKAITDTWDIIDSRLEETNNRELAFLQYYKTLDMESRIKIAMIMDLLYGRTSEESLKARILEQTQVENGVIMPKESN